jgi:glycosyltransferase involved in cell wall biosynthesis
MKVLALTTYLSERGGGIPSSFLPLYDRLSEKGIEVVLVAADKPSRPVKPRIVTFHPVGPRSFAFSWELPRILEGESADIVHLHGLWSYGSVAVQLWSWRSGKPVVVSPHGMVDGWALRHQALKKTVAGAMYEWRNLRNAARIHALNESETNSLETLGYTNVVRIPNGVNVPARIEPAIAEKKIVLFLGRLHPKKGIAETLVAWSLFQRETRIAPDGWQLVIAGWDDGGYLDDLKKIVEKLEISEHVKFLDPIFGAEKEALYASAHALVLASHSEGLPMTVLEAWSHGKPAFLTDQCNLPEGFASGAAFRITTEPENIAATMVSVLPDTSRLFAAGKAARALAIRSFDWDEICNRWVSLYRSLHRRGARREEGHSTVR